MPTFKWLYIQRKGTGILSERPNHTRCISFSGRSKVPKTRVSRSGIHLQLGAAKAFKDISWNILIWLEDWLLHTKTFIKHMEVTERFFGLCNEWSFTLSPAKCNLITQKAKWCGHMVTAEGTTLDPRRIDGLLSMQKPETAGDPQLFICAINGCEKRSRTTIAILLRCNPFYSA